MIKPNYQLLYDTIIVNTKDQRDVSALVAKIKTNAGQYKAVTKALTDKHPTAKVPWQFIACCHYLECSLRFDKHLCNGDSLSHKTVHVPIGRPAGPGPWTWQESALDALEIEHLQDEQDWSVTNMLYRLEKFNGYGYTLYHNMPSPYLFAGSNHYIKGKYTSDGNFDPKAVSKQIGAALLLKQIL